MRASIKLIQFLVVAMIIGITAFSITIYANVQTFTVKVDSKERITQSVGDKIESFYLVYTDKGTFKLEDDFFRGNFYSSDVYGRIKQDSTYTFKTLGYRIGVMSEYPNIIEVK